MGPTIFCFVMKNLECICPVKEVRKPGRRGGAGTVQSKNVKNCAAKFYLRATAGEHILAHLGDDGGLTAVGSSTAVTFKV